MQSLWLYLHFPQLQLDSLLAQQANSQEQGALIIVNEADMQVVQLSSQAADAGIVKGMSLGAAAALERNLQVLPYQPKVEKSKLTEVADRLYLVTSDICLFSASGLLLRIHNMLNLYGDLEHYWRVIQNQLASLRLTYQYATGQTPLAAKTLALSHLNKITANTDKLSACLSNTPLPFSELDDKSVYKLSRVGVHSLGELLTIPLSDIAKRFTQELATYLARLSGELPQPVNFYHPKQHFERYLELLYEITNSQTLLHPLLNLLNALEQFLKLRDWLTQTLTIKLHQRDSEALIFHVGSQQGEYQAKVWANIIELELEKVALLAPVFAITLITSDTYVRQPDKEDLFAGKRGELTRLQLVSLLQAKLGEQNVFSPTFADDYRPEKQVSKQPALSEQAKPENLQAMRPIFLLEEPQPLRQKVSIQHGPERLQTGWWDNELIRRDYFIAQTQQGQWYWIFRTAKQDWYLHGIFS